MCAALRKEQRYWRSVLAVDKKLELGKNNQNKSKKYHKKKHNYFNNFRE
jgi:hypothetical protein